jgi:hypothetical protein
MQKNAEPNTVLVARKIIEPLRQLEEFTHTTQVIDGYEASVWRDTGYGLLSHARLRPSTPHIRVHHAARLRAAKKAAPNAGLSVAVDHGDQTARPAPERSAATI